MEANINHIACDYTRCGDTYQIVNAKAGIKFTEQLVSILGKPAFVPEFENGWPAFGHTLDKGSKPVKVFVKIRRQLIKNRAEVILKQSRPLEKPLE